MPRAPGTRRPARFCSSEGASEIPDGSDRAAQSAGTSESNGGRREGTLQQGRARPLSSPRRRLLPIDRRTFLQSLPVAAAGLAFPALLPAWARSATLAPLPAPRRALRPRHRPPHRAHPLVRRGPTRPCHDDQRHDPRPADPLEGRPERAARRDERARRGHLHPLARPDPALPVRRGPRCELPRDPAGRDVRLRVPGRAGGHLLVSQPFRPPGAGGTLRPARDRAGGGRSDPVRSGVRDRALGLQLHPSPHALPAPQAAGRRLQLSTRPSPACSPDATSPSRSGASGPGCAWIRRTSPT